MDRLKTIKVISCVMALTLMLGACSGGDGAESASDVAAPTGSPTEGAAGADEQSGPDETASSDGSRSAASIRTPSGVEVSVPKGGGAPVANLFTAAEDKIGIHDDRIVLCGHAATSLGSAFGVSTEDLLVYWQEVGKIHGRRVEVTFENDNYDPTTARQAAQACYDKKPFFLLGGIGFDQIPAVRKFAEDKHLPYYHHIARQDLTKKYSFSPLPSVEQIGDFGGQWIGSKYKGRKIGIVYRESENWDPGHKTFLKRVKALGGDVVAEVGVQNNQGSYFTEVNELRSRGAQVVFVWENVLAATSLIQQSKGQGFNPRWVVFPFNLMTDTLGNQALQPTIEGLAVWPAYSRGDRSGPFAAYADELKRFEDAYRRRRSGVNPTDIHWQVWLSWKGLHQTLLACGRDCTRNKIVGLSLQRALTFAETKPACPVDYTRNGHVGGFWATMFTTYERPDGNAGWRHVPGRVCKSSLL